MPSITQRRATAADVARLSGVSRATVSYVLNQTAGQTIPEATRERVHAAAAELGYVPNAPAQALARGRSHLVVIDISNVPLSEVVGHLAHELADAFRERGYVPLVDQLTRGQGDHSLLQSLALSLTPHAVVTMADLPEALRNTLLRAGVQHIASLTPANTPWSVEAQMSSTAKIQYDHLVARGHTRIAYAAPSEPELATLASIRRQGIAEAAALHHLTINDLQAPLTPADMAAALRGLHADGITAIAAYNDTVALRLLAAAARAGLRVPDELAIMGIDDDSAAAWSYPALTTVNQTAPSSLTAAERVDRILKGETSTPGSPPGAYVVERESA